MRIVNIRLTRTDKEELNMEKIIFQSDDGTAAEFLRRGADQYCGCDLSFWCPIHRMRKQTHIF